MQSQRTEGARRAPQRHSGADPVPLDGEAVEALVLAHQGAVRAYLRYLGCSAASVDDLVQDTFLTFLSAQFEQRDERASSRYLRSIARHLFLKSLRRLDREPPTLDLDAAESTWARFYADGGGAPYLDALKGCLQRVGGRTKEALVLRYESGLRRAAIAARLAVTESAVHSMLVRARRKLRECVERRLEA